MTGHPTYCIVLTMEAAASITITIERSNTWKR
nr:MAG TPA: hypothetical protein [Caudoviricetes sp.]